MKTAKLALVSFATVAVASSAFAQPIACSPQRTLRIARDQPWVHPTDVRDFVVRFAGKTLTASGTPVVTLRRKAQADASPSALVTASVVSGGDYTITIAPDTGCGAAGCRAGNLYQIDLKPTTGDSETLLTSLCLQVKKTVLR